LICRGTSLKLFEFLRSGIRPGPRGLSSELSEPELFAIAREVDEALQHGYRWQYFTSRLEAIFERETAAARARYLILAGLVAIAIYNAFLFIDYRMMPDIFKTNFIVHFGIITPMAFLIIAALYRGLVPSLREGVEASITILTCASILYCAVLSKSPDAVYYSNAIMLVIIFGNIVIRLRFWYAVAASLSILVIFALFFPAVHGNSMLVQADNLIVLSSCIGLTLFANYNLEQDQRRAYLLGLRDRFHRADLTASNLRLVELSRIDPLTGIPNRRELDDYMDHLAQGSRLAKLAIVMLDIDHFKSYNDLYGHPAGDECLQRIAGALRDALRHSGDMVARFGGEEFVAVLPGNDLQGAELVAERMRLVVQKLAIPHAGWPEVGVVTLSAGIAAATSGGPGDIQAILAAADAALYRAKSGGRNRVER
jgi:diguanylate cyclase (GGDEF)-like protein